MMMIEEALRREVVSVKKINKNVSVWERERQEPLILMNAADAKIAAAHQDSGSTVLLCHVQS